MRRLTLSFDNGPVADVTPGVLEALDAARATATFFVSGKEASDPQRRPLLEAIRAAGHRIGNHTQSHSVELGATRDPEAPRREIEDAQSASPVSPTPTSCSGRMARAACSARACSAAPRSTLCDGGYTCVLWNSVPRDWEDVAGWPERALADLSVNDWTLLVLHDVASGAMRALPDFLARARDAGASSPRSYRPRACRSCAAAWSAHSTGSWEADDGANPEADGPVAAPAVPGRDRRAGAARRDRRTRVSRAGRPPARGLARAGIELTRALATAVDAELGRSISVMQAVVRASALDATTRPFHRRMSGRELAALLAGDRARRARWERRSPTRATRTAPRCLRSLIARASTRAGPRHP